MSTTSSLSEGGMSLYGVQEDYEYETDCTTPAPSCLGEHIENEEVEAFRAEEYPQLADQIYLDHGGATLYAKSLVTDFSNDLTSNLYGNPHSDSTPSAVAGHRIDAIREKALRFFKADPREWDLVFVANATAAIKLTIECIRDHAAATRQPLWYGYHRDAHTSMVGIRELTSTSRCFESDEEVEKWIDHGGAEARGSISHQLGLFAYPGQSNMTGRRLPLNWCSRIKEKFSHANTHTLLDAAALASTAPLDLSCPRESPDFVALSFYKIFGFPNVGALLVQRSSAHILSSRRYFGGGTVDMVISINDTWHAPKSASVHDALEDGTLPFHNIFALDHAIDVHERLYGPEPMKFISRHTAQLSKQLYDGLCALRHGNAAPVIRVYKEAVSVYGDSRVQGATIAFNVLKADGSLVGYQEVERAADARRIYVRSGSLCNPGGMATYLGWSPEDMRAAFAAGHRCSNPTQIVDGRATGVVRASMGGMSTSSDVRALLSFLRDTYLDTTIPIPKQVIASRRQASIFKVQMTIPDNDNVRATTPNNTPIHIPYVHAQLPYRPPPAIRNRFRKSLDFANVCRPGSSVTSISSNGNLPRSQSSNLVGIKSKPILGRQPSLLRRESARGSADIRPTLGRWDSFWKEEEESTPLTAAAAAAPETKKLKEKGGLRRVARAFTLSRHSSRSDL